MVTNNVCHHLVQLLFQYIHRHIAFLHNGSLLLRFRQRTFVHLLVLIQWDDINLHRHSRYHIRWFLVEDEIVECLDVYLLVADNVCSNELSSTIFIKSLDGSIFDTRELTDDSFHLFQFDTETTYLHLSITTSHKLDVAIGQITNDVARTIDASIFLHISERIGDIHLCRLFRTIQVTSTHLWTTHPQFASSTNRQTMTLRVNNVKTHVIKRSANRNLLHLLVH